MVLENKRPITSWKLWPCLWATYGQEWWLFYEDGDYFYDYVSSPFFIYVNKHRIDLKILLRLLMYFELDLILNWNLVTGGMTLNKLDTG